MNPVETLFSVRCFGRWSLLGVAVLVLAACQNPLPKTGPIPAVTLPADADGYAIDRFVVHRLLTGTDRRAWVDQWIAAPLPDDVVSLRVRLNLMVRDDQWAQAWRTVTQLENLDPPSDQITRENRQMWSETAGFLIDWWQDPLARRIVERRPDAAPGNLRSLAFRWQEKVGLEEVDAWLVECQQNARRLRVVSPAAEFEFRPPSPEDRYWLATRHGLYRWLEFETQLLAQLESRARDQSNNREAQLDYLWVARHHQPRPRPEAAWVVDHFQNTGAYDAFRLGETVTRWGWPADGAVLLKRSLVTAFNDADEAALRARSRLSAVWRAPVPRDELERSLRWETRHALVEAYVKSDQADLAQPIVEALAAESDQDVPPSLAQLAGLTQASTGQRVIETRLLDAEPENKDDPAYWKRRAQYFEGRSEWTEAESAYRLALKKTPLHDSAPQLKPSAYARASAVSNLSFFYKRQQRSTEGRDLVFTELAEVDPAHPYATRLVDQLWHNHRRAITVDRKLLWDWLAATDDWRFRGSHVLMLMADNGKPEPRREKFADQRPQVWSQAEALAAGSPNRSATLGWLMSKHDPARALTLLEYAAQNIEPDERSRVRSHLMSAYESLNDFDRMRELWPETGQRFDSQETSRWLRRVAQAAEDQDHPSADHWRKLYRNLARQYE